MSLHLVEEINYRGDEGVRHMRHLQSALTEALKDQNWDQVRHLDSVCIQLVDKVITANKDDKKILFAALSELKGVYSRLIIQCQCEVAVMAH